MTCNMILSLDVILITNEMPIKFSEYCWAADHLRTHKYTFHIMHISIKIKQKYIEYNIKQHNISNFFISF